MKSGFFLVTNIISQVPWTVTTTLLPNIFGSHVKKAGPSVSGTQQQFYEVGVKLMDSHCFLLFFAISSKLLKKLCQFCAAGAKSSAFQFIYSSYNGKTRPVLVPHIVCKTGSFWWCYVSMVYRPHISLFLISNSTPVKITSEQSRVSHQFSVKPAIR